MLRRLTLVAPRLAVTGGFTRMMVARCYSNRSRDFVKDNVIVKSLAYVKEVDQQQDRLERSPVEAKIAKLIEVIENNHECLYLLLMFHYECDQMYIGQDVSLRRKRWNYPFNHMFKLRPIHLAFWENCRILDMANHNHKLGYDIHDLGLLDPKNFSEEDYHQLQTGIFHGTDFRNVEGVSFTRPWRLPHNES